MPSGAKRRGSDSSLFYRGQHRGRGFKALIARPSKLKFGDLSGDGVTEVIAVENGHRAIPKAGSSAWRWLNSTLVARLNRTSHFYSEAERASGVAPDWEASSLN